LITCIPAEEIDFEFEIGHFCNLWTSMTLNLTFDLGQGHTVVHLSSSTNYVIVPSSFTKFVSQSWTILPKFEGHVAPNLSG